MTERLADRLRRLRDEHGLSIADLAGAASTSEGTIRQLEAGKVKSPSLLLGIRLADALHIDPRFLAHGEGESTGERFADHEQRLRTLERRLAALESRRR